MRGKQRGYHPYPTEASDLKDDEHVISNLLQQT